MKKILCIAAIVGMVLTGCDDTPGTGDGPGSETDPYLIGTAAQLKKLADEVNAGDNKAGKYYKLTANIDLSGYQSGAGWTPIGNNETTGTQFCGNFNGDGYVVSKLLINTHKSNVGLFGCIYNGGVVKNLGVKGTVEGVEVNFGDANCIGGIVGFVCKNSKVENCYWMGDVSGIFNVGGIAGQVHWDSEVTNCYTTGKITSASGGGGIAGIVRDGSKISKCAALNEEIKDRGPNSGFARVVGSNNGGAAYNNIAWDGMKVIGSTVSDSNENGLGKSKVQIKNNDSFDEYFPSPLWAKASNKLPGFRGNTESMPTYLATP